MKVFNKCYYLIFVVLTLSGCETKEDKICRDQLSSIVRQINSIYQGYADNKSAEESINMLGARSYYSNYTNQFTELRNELAKQNTTKRFTNYNKLINQIISDGIKYFNNRQDLMLQLFEINSTFSEFSRYAELSIKYLKEATSSDYSRDYYKDLSNEYETKAKSSLKETIQSLKSLEKLYSESEDKINILIYTSDSLNNMGGELKIIDSLCIHDIISDTTDFLIQIKNQTNTIIESIDIFEGLY